MEGLVSKTQVVILVVAVVVGPYAYLTLSHAREQRPGSRLATFIRGVGSLGMLASFFLGLGLPIATFASLEAFFLVVWFIGVRMKGNP